MAVVVEVAAAWVVPVPGLAAAAPLAEPVQVGMSDETLAVAAALAFVAATRLAAVAFSWFSSQYLPRVVVTSF